MFVSHIRKLLHTFGVVANDTAPKAAEEAAERRAAVQESLRQLREEHTEAVAELAHLQEERDALEACVHVCMHV